MKTDGSKKGVGIKEMIIRNQSKTTLLDTTGIALAINLKNNSIIAYHTSDLTSDSYIPLGIYSTEEKAKQVLDVLSLEIRTGRSFYQMPEDMNENQ